MTLYKKAEKGDLPGSLPKIFESGMREFLKSRSGTLTEPSAMIDGARRAMRAAFQRELDGLERNLPFLASTALYRHISDCLARSGESCMPSQG